jgi:hypothetical protein
MRIQVLILLLLNVTIFLSGQDSLRLRYSVYYPDGKKYTGNTKDPAQLAYEFEEKGRVWLYTVAHDKTDQRSVIAFKLFTSIPLWVYTVDNSSEINRLIKSVKADDLMTSERVESELRKYIKRGTLTDVFILQTLGRPDKLTYYDEKNRKVNQWTYSKLHLYLIFTNRIVTNYIDISKHQ